MTWPPHGLLVTLSLLPTLLPEQAPVAAGKLLQWKGDADVHQEGHLLLKSVYVLTGTDAVSSRPHWPRLPGWARLTSVPAQGSGIPPGCFLSTKLTYSFSPSTPLG